MLDFAAIVQQQLAKLPPSRRYCLALSGGLDSSVLLHVLQTLPLQQDLLAIHIDHGLQAQSSQWRRHCESLCRQNNIPLTVVEVDAKALPGQSPEAAARTARYAALAECIKTGDCLLTAQHQDDQAETVLLQLLRGSGPAGLAAMPLTKPFAAGHHARPLLTVSRQDIFAYAQRHALQWVEDPSNADLHFERNYLRHNVMPLLQQRWPGYAKTLSRVAAHQASLLRLQTEWAAIDSASFFDVGDQSLAIAGVIALTPQRRDNLLRYWLQQLGLPAPSTAVLEQIVGLLQCADDANPAVTWGNAEARRYRGRCYAFIRPKPLIRTEWLWPVAEPLVIAELGVSLDRNQLQQLGIVLPTAVNTLHLRLRRGGERIKLPGWPHAKSLKKWLQERGVPPWQRERLLLLYDSTDLLAVLNTQPVITLVT